MARASTTAIYSPLVPVRVINCRARGTFIRAGCVFIETRCIIKSASAEL